METDSTARIGMNTDSPEQGKPRIVAVMTDLFFAVQIREAAKKSGCAVEILNDRAAALEKTPGSSLAIIDLNYSAIDPIGLIREIKADAGSKNVRLIGFVSHVQTELRRQAQDAGCDLVLPRSAFAQKLPEIFNQLA